MAITLTEEEKKLVQEGKLDYSSIEEHRKTHPVKPIDLNEAEKIKEEIRQTSLLYKESIQKNKDLYRELEENRKTKEQHRNRLAELRKKKKEILGLQ